MTGTLYNTAILLSIASLVTSQESSSTNTSQPRIYPGSDGYKYYGCYNETTQIQDSAEDRALADGTHLVKAGKMTVPMCLEFCTSNGTQYKYAGLEWSRECWCSPYLSSLSAKLGDDDCENPCEGNSSQVCGGPLRLSAYQLSEGDASNRGDMLLAPGAIFSLSIIVLPLLSL
ncbi:hypothetical protein FPOAC2_01184 [Fusarium poae]|jgi:hypothetical protein|uniref:hypothetical protein n=1 Tax=Fusarium poae TaxID=36050 RepID=UPI001CE83CCD|nr:hypothetical protein FPOAC1_001117 [Fusarium poae]KAG8675140.1 hypothetical protein FPOAC1_001117 [Fusarium poae]